MRKPVVVVSAAAALLLAGGVVATSAAADERPDSPGWTSFWWPSLFGDDRADRHDYRGGDFHDDDFGDGDFRDDDFHGDDRAFGEPFADRGPAERPRLDDDARRDDRVRPQQRDRASRQQPDAAGRQPQRPVSAERPLSPQRPHLDQRAARQKQQQSATRQRQQQSAARQKQQQSAAQQRQQQRPARQQRVAGGVLAAARQAVTARDVSASPSAPVQQRVLVLVNQNRRRAGCAPFILDRRLIKAANQHASDMARRRYFDHESPNGERAGDRVSDAGYRWKRYGENIARGADSPWEVVDGWMNSRSHRENILDCRLREMGVGLAISRDRTPYWVQNFATPRY
ncbi:CAP domain-containing protein [Actinoplanes sp. M2I2]|uniref:CAP domain-containing protein n=1 Tax=Actinoplanes sp. M2I2 TaxID=1734444 RepID=UPI0020213190|nr:CAP domain-containing protein [Actinoplanes sp. M2I2]